MKVSKSEIFITVLLVISLGILGWMYNQKLSEIEDREQRIETILRPVEDCIVLYNRTLPSEHWGVDNFQHPRDCQEEVGEALHEYLNYNGEDK